MKTMTAGLILISISNTLMAQFIPLAQVRTVESQAVVNSEAFAATDFERFTETADSFYSASPHFCCAYGEARQDSVLRTSYIGMGMYARGHISAGPGPARGRSYFEYDFALSSSVACELRGTLLGRGFQISDTVEMSIVLTGPSGEIYSVVSEIPTFTVIPVLYDAVFEPGSYTLTVELTANGLNGLIPSEAIANLSLSGCGGDFDDSGVVDIDDLTRLLSNFGASGAQYEDGDMTADNVIDLNDLTELLSRYGQICE